MKKIVMLLVSVLVAGAASAQVSGLKINIRGGFDVRVELGDGQWAEVTADGYLADIHVHGRIEYHTPFTTNERYLEGLVRQAGGFRFEYHDGWMSSERIKQGKIKKIGNVAFDYYSDSFSSDRDRDGMLSRVDNTRLVYYDNFGSFNEGKSGRLRRIGNVNFDWWGGNDFFMPSDSRYVWKTGLLKTIGVHSYDYIRRENSHPGGSHGSAGGNQGWGGGRTIVTGPRRVEVGGMVITVVGGW